MTSTEKAAIVLISAWGLMAINRWTKGGRHRGSSLRVPGRRVVVVTTASLPWMTGTAVNPLLRAAYLAHGTKLKVTLVIPWLSKSDQSIIFPNDITFDTQTEQETWVRQWVEKRTGFTSNFGIVFYPGRYDPVLCSVLPSVGDITKSIPGKERDIAVLEEPEHLTWFQTGTRWTDRFKHVVGIAHTNYVDYIGRKAGPVGARLISVLNQILCRVHCHKVIKLSDAVQPLPRECTQFVHGVANGFLAVGEKLAQQPSGKRFSKGAYFIGKVIWAKGYTELLDLTDAHKQRGEASVAIDCFGSGEDLDEVKAQAQRKGLPLTFHGARDHADESIQAYQVFVNPSLSDVVATTSCEALAMGKWLICADHPENAFFSTFSNCLIYKTPEEFSKHLRYALEHEPAPLVGEDRTKLTWEAATERFLDAAEIKRGEWARGVETLQDRMTWQALSVLTGIEAIRRSILSNEENGNTQNGRLRTGKSKAPEERPSRLL